MRKAWLNCWLNTVETAGTYQLNWNAYINFDPAAISAHQFNLKVNGITVAVSYNHSASTGFQPAVISALLPLDAAAIMSVSLLTEANSIKAPEVYS